MAESSTASDVAAEIKEKRRGRPRKSEAGNEAARARWRRSKAKTRGAVSPSHDDEDAGSSERPPYTPNPESVALCSILGNTIWNFSRIIHKHRALTTEEQQTLGAAIDPVFYKYLPALEGWKAELTLVAVVWGLWSATAPPEPAEDAAKAPESESHAEVIP